MAQFEKIPMQKHRDFFNEIRLSAGENPLSRREILSGEIAFGNVRADFISLNDAVMQFHSEGISLRSNFILSENNCVTLLYCKSAARLRLLLDIPCGHMI